MRLMPDGVLFTFPLTCLTSLLHHHALLGRVPLQPCRSSRQLATGVGGGSITGLPGLTTVTRRAL